MSKDTFTPEFLALLKSVDEAYPFKRIVISQHMMGRYNSMFGSAGERTTQMAITVKKGVEMTEEEIWDALVKIREAVKNAIPIDFRDGSWDKMESGAPVTGMQKRQIID